LEPQQAVFVGDNPYEDILGAKNVGMRAVLINSPVVERARSRLSVSLPKPEGTVGEPDAIIRDMKELPTLLEEWNMDWRTESSHRELILTGRVVTGVGQGTMFTQLPWAKEQFVDKLGVDPYPGTLNLKIEDPDHLASLSALWQHEGICIPPPTSDFCAAKGFRVMVADRFPGAIVFPLVPGYAQDIIEIISPVHLRSSLGAEEGSVVTVKVTL
jgi:CTP-dependent riboflavin kinase